MKDKKNAKTALKLLKPGRKLTTTIRYSPAIAAVQFMSTNVLLPSFSRTCTCLQTLFCTGMKVSEGSYNAIIEDL